MMQNDEHFVYLLCVRDVKMHRSELRCIDMMPKKPEKPGVVELKP